MRKTSRPFTFEIKNQRRPPRASHEDQTGPDELPSRDIHSDYDEQPRDPRDAYAAAEALFSRSKPFQSEDDLPIHSTDIFPPLKPKPVEVVAEAAPEPDPERQPEPEEVRPPRILQAVTNSYSDPVQELLAAEMERRRGGRPRRTSTESIKTRKVKQAFETAPEAAQEAAPIQATQPPIYSPSLPRGPLPPLRLRPRHKEPRILYNAWNYELFKREARHVPRSVAEVILTPGNRWKRRLPVDKW